MGEKPLKLKVKWVPTVLGFAFSMQREKLQGKKLHGSQLVVKNC